MSLLSTGAGILKRLLGEFKYSFSRDYLVSPSGAGILKRLLGESKYRGGHSSRLLGMPAPVLRGGHSQETTW